ncbi:MAG: mechanosensitive ion channel [bacterium]|nr:mechanosensitive ion channel [bacterium]
MIFDTVFAWLEQALGVSPELQSKLLISLVLILGLGLLHRVALNIASRQTEDVRVQYRLRKTITYTVSVLGVLLVGRLWLEGFHSLSIYLGLLSAGLAIALREPVVNLAGWAFILWRRPFDVGDRIQIGSHAGDVIDQRIFQFTMLEIGNWVDADQSTGRIIHVPNGKVFGEALANYTSAFQYIWNEVPVLITFESDWKKAKEILQAIAVERSENLSEFAQRQIRSAARKFMIFYTNLTPTVYTSVKDSGVLLTVRYLCDPRRRRGTEQAIWEDILTAFAAYKEIDFAYPTQRFFNHIQEGKSGMPPNPDSTGMDE